MEHTVLETLPSCAICTGSAFLSVFSAIDHTVSGEAFNLVDCASCGARYTNPRPDAQSIGAYYSSPDYISHTNTSRTFQDRLYQIARRWALRRKHAVLAKHRVNGRALDIGCGTGEFLGFLKSRGYLVQGVEPDLGAREQAIANHALDVFPNLESIPSNEQLQVVTMWHVLEHVADIRKYFKKIYSILADRGVLLIAVPDHESWDASHYGPDWAAYDVPRHLNHFRQTDLKRLLHEHGFVVMEIKSMWLDAPYIAMLSERNRGRSPLHSLLVGALVGAWSNLQAVLGGHPTSSTLYIVQKQEA